MGRYYPAQSSLPHRDLPAPVLLAYSVRVTWTGKLLAAQSR
jgi:hypothetical protein